MQSEVATSDLPVQSKAMTVVDPDGDLILVVGTEKTRVRVSSNDVARTPVFRAMLLGSFKESRGGPDKEVSLPEDDYDALHFLLCIAHAKFDLLPSPENFSFENALQVAVLCDKYDMVSLMGPFYERYILAHYSFGGTLFDQSCSWLFISWVFGHETIYDHVFDYMVRNIGMESEGDAKPKTPAIEAEFMKDLIIPPGVLGEWFLLLK